MNEESVSAKMIVTLVVGGNTIELSESDARKVLGELQKIFKVEIKTAWKDHNPFRDYPPRWTREGLTPQLPSPFSPTITCETSLVK